MNISISNFLQNLESLHGREFQTLYQKTPFTLLFHDTTKLRIRLEYRDISVPISILLLGLLQLVSRKKFDKSMCTEILGKDWGFQFVVRLLLECDDVILSSDPGPTTIVRVSKKQTAQESVNFVAPPPKESVAINGGNGRPK